MDSRGGGGGGDNGGDKGADFPMDTRADNCGGLSFCKSLSRQRGISQPKEKTAEIGRAHV